VREGKSKGKNSRFNKAIHAWHKTPAFAPLVRIILTHFSAGFE